MASEQELQSKSGLCELQTRLLMLCESMSWDVTLCRADSLIHRWSIGRCWWNCIFWQADISPQSWSLSGCDNNASDESYCSKKSLLKESSMPWGLIRYFDSWSWFNIVEGNVGVVFLIVTMMMTFVELLILMLIKGQRWWCRCLWENLDLDTCWLEAPAAAVRKSAPQSPGVFSTWPLLVGL